MRQRRAPLTKRFISGSSSNQPACLGTERELCSLYVLKTGGGDVAGFCRGSSGFGVDRAVCRDDRDLGASNSQSVALRSGFRDDAARQTCPVWQPWELAALGIGSLGNWQPWGKAG